MEQIGQSSQFFYKKPDHLILHVGTNDLAYSNANQVAERTVKLTGMVTFRGVNCSVSELTVRDDDLWAKVKEVNNLLDEKLPQNVKISSNSNITPNHLYRSGTSFESKRNWCSRF